MHLSLSVEDTNRLRHKLGLKLISTAPETVAPVYDPKTADFKSRLADVAKRREAKLPPKLPQDSSHEEAAQVAPKVESTESWLAKMKERDVPSLVESLNQKILHSIGDFESQKTNAKSFEPPDSCKVVADEPESKQADNSKNTLSFVSSTPVAYEDPLDAPNEAELLKEGSKEQPLKALFKPKRLMNNAKVRKKAAPAWITMMARSKKEEDEELSFILSQSLKRHKPNNASQLGPTNDQELEAHIFERPSQAEQNGLVIDTTRIQLSLAQESEKSPEIQDKESQTVELQSEIEGVNEKLLEYNQKKQITSTHLEGVAGILRQISAPEKSVNSHLSRASKSWARRLAEKRRERENEQAQLENLYQSLPPKERKKAIELHLRRAAQDQMQEAQDFVKHYRPEIQIEYKDDTGRQIDGRSAFKRLSRAFHQARLKK